MRINLPILPFNLGLLYSLLISPHRGIFLSKIKEVIMSAEDYIKGYPMGYQMQYDEFDRTKIIRV